MRWPEVCLTGGKADGKSLPGIPHRNEFVPVSGDPLCLFFGMHEWNPSMSLTDTIPWTSLWLRFFEAWLVPNTWEWSFIRRLAPEMPSWNCAWLATGIP